MHALTSPASTLPTVAVRSLVAAYGERIVLDGVNVEVMPGEVHVILGGSGCGKSTLLKHMIGLYAPRSGSVQLLGVELADADEPVRDAALTRIGMLFQNGALLNSLSIHDNVALPIVERWALPTEVVDEMVRMKLALVDLEGKGHLTPPELSGGMRKRAALARALATDPAVLFCDEPGAGLDPITAAGLDALLLGLKERFGMSLVVVTHELQSIERIADRVTMLDQGRVLAQGTLAQVRASPHEMVQAFFAAREQSTQAEVSLLQALTAEGAA